MPNNDRGLLSLAGAWALATWFAAPGLGDTRGQLRTAERTAAQARARLVRRERHRRRSRVRRATEARRATRRPPVSTSVLVVDRPSRFRSALESALKERGGQVELTTDALHALARAESAPPDVIALADTLEAGELSPDTLCRLIERRAPGVRVVRLRERGTDRLAGEPLEARGTFIPRSFGPDAVAVALLAREANTRSFAFEIAPAQLGHALVWLLDRRATGVLTLQGDGHERELSLLHGMPVHARSTLPSERLGALIAKHKAIAPERLADALGWARASGTRIGTALVQLALIEPSELFGALARQTQEQLEAACAGYFVDDEEQATV